MAASWPRPWPSAWRRSGRGSRDDALALLAAFPDPATAQGIDAAIERGLAQGGAEDVSARFRGPQRLVEFEGGTYLLPTVIYCEDLEHPLANQEYLFPFVSVLDVPAAELIDTLGPSLVVTALTDDPRLERDLLGPARDRPLEPGAACPRAYCSGTSRTKETFLRTCISSGRSSGNGSQKCRS